jgi:two-component system, cell cycle sensor histidine kinase and response regulator CckA
MQINLKNKSLNYLMGGIVCTFLAFGLGYFLLVSNDRLAHGLSSNSYNLSFDLSYLNRPNLKNSGVIIVFIDDKSYKDFDEPEDRALDRKWHAELLNRLAKDKAKAVVMDIIFSDPSPVDRPNSDAKFADAIKSNGHVILGVDYIRPTESTERPLPNVKGELVTTEGLDKVLTYPYGPFREAAARLGLVQLTPDQDLTIRKHFKDLDNEDIERVVKNERANVPPTLSMAAANLIGLKVAAQPSDRWIYYYGRPYEAIPNVGLSEAFSMPPGFFKDKIVFVGAHPMTGQWSEIRDEAVSPYFSFGSPFIKIPLVEVHATEFLNLLRHDWLSRPAPAAENLTLFLMAAIFGFGLLRFRPLIATGLAIVGALSVVLVHQWVFNSRHVWFSWLIIVAAQIPCALIYSIVFNSLEWLAQRRKLEAERRRAHERIREQAALLDKAQDAIIVHDLDWRAQYWNKSAENLYGWSFEEVQLLNLKNDVFKTDENKLLEALQLSLANGEWIGELRQNTKAGKSLLVQSRWTLVRDEGGKPKSILVINTDVTEQKKLEAQFLRTQRMESIGTLAGGIAHDLNNVLSPILMGVEMMRMKNDNDEFTKKMLATMSSSAKRGSDMVKQVLTFARGHEGERSVLQISHLVREMQKIVKETFPKSIEFKTVLSEGLWPILGDATQIHQIILNLCVNARDAMPNGGQISVALKNVTLTEDEAKQHVGAKPVQYVLLAVTDTGTGIPPEIMDKIFEPFFTTKEIGKGTGLGLSTVISIIKSHGGFLDLQSQVGKGTSFNVHLPAAAEAVPVASVPTPPESLRGEGETVMIVDDEPAVLDLTRQLMVHFGYKVVTAIHGADAVALFPQYKDKIKVLVIDMMMPVMDGPTAIRALRKLDPKLPVIAISGLMAGDKIQEQLGDVGVVFIPKPFTTEKLLIAIRDAIIGTTPDSQKIASNSVPGVKQPTLGK